MLFVRRISGSMPGTIIVVTCIIARLLPEPLAHVDKERTGAMENCGPPRLVFFILTFPAVLILLRDIREIPPRPLKKGG